MNQVSYEYIQQLNTRNKNYFDELKSHYGEFSANKLSEADRIAMFKREHVKSVLHIESVDTENYNLTYTMVYMPKEEQNKYIGKLPILTIFSALYKGQIYFTNISELSSLNWNNINALMQNQNSSRPISNSIVNLPIEEFNPKYEIQKLDPKLQKFVMQYKNIISKKDFLKLKQYNPYINDIDTLYTVFVNFDNSQLTQIFQNTFLN